MAMVIYAFEHLQLQRLDATAFARNAPSIRILQRLGFSSEGLRPAIPEALPASKTYCFGACCAKIFFADICTSRAKHDTGSVSYNRPSAIATKTRSKPMNNHYPHPILAREGWPFITIAIVVSLLVTWLAGWWSIPFWIVTVFVVQFFFRDPARVIPQDPKAVLSPADGRIVVVEKAMDRTARLKR